jgi:hypothetical protein
MAFSFYFTGRAANTGQQMQIPACSFFVSSRSAGSTALVAPMMFVAFAAIIHRQA